MPFRGAAFFSAWVVERHAKAQVGRPMANFALI